LWAAGSAVWSRRDDGTWGPNYSNILGNLIGSSISNFYYPESQRTVGSTFSRGFIVTAEGALGSELVEFWPDVVRHYQRKKAEKLVRQAGENGAQKTLQPNTSPSSNPQN